MIDLHKNVDRRNFDRDFEGDDIIFTIKVFVNHVKYIKGTLNFLPNIGEHIKLPEHTVKVIDIEYVWDRLGNLENHVNIYCEY